MPTQNHDKAMEALNPLRAAVCRKLGDRPYRTLAEQAGIPIFTGYRFLHEDHIPNAVNLAKLIKWSGLSPVAVVSALAKAY